MKHTKETEFGSPSFENHEPSEGHIHETLHNVRQERRHALDALHLPSPEHARNETPQVIETKTNHPAHRHEGHTAHHAPIGRQLSIPHGLAAVEEPLESGMTKSALVTGSLGMVTPLAIAAVNTAPALGVGIVPAIGTLGAIPLAGAGIGYLVGKKFKHPIIGTTVGGGLGAAAGITALHTIGVSSLAPSLGAGGATLVAGAVGTATAASLALSAGSAALAGVLTYGLGHVHNKIWGGKPGVLGTYLRGIIAPISIPVGLIGKGINHLRKGQ